MILETPPAVLVDSFKKSINDFRISCDKVAPGQKLINNTQYQTVASYDGLAYVASWFVTITTFFIFGCTLLFIPRNNATGLLPLGCVFLFETVTFHVLEWMPFVVCTLAMW